MNQTEQFLDHLPIQHWMHDWGDRKVWELMWVANKPGSDFFQNYFNHAQELVEMAASDSEEEMCKARLRLAIRMTQLLFYGVSKRGTTPFDSAHVGGINTFPEGGMDNITDDYEYWGPSQRLFELRVPKGKSVPIDLFKDEAAFPPEMHDAVYAVLPGSVVLMRPNGCNSWCDEIGGGFKSVFSLRLYEPFPIRL